MQSGPIRTHLLELFTSEGCSSCPPAESWFSTLRQNPRLWKEVVPIAFHVDYWNTLGWTDKFAKGAFTARQRNYAASWGADTVYTPCFVLDGREWRERDLDSIFTSKAETGTLNATLHENGEVRITFQPIGRSGRKWQAHAALLGFDVVSNVMAGENSGRRLVHDFMVLDLQASGMQGNPPSAVLRLPVSGSMRGQMAFAVWITEQDGLEPLQAAGGSL